MRASPRGGAQENGQTPDTAHYPPVSGSGVLQASGNPAADAGGSRPGLRRTGGPSPCRLRGPFPRRSRQAYECLPLDGRADPGDRPPQGCRRPRDGKSPSDRGRAGTAAARVPDAMASGSCRSDGPAQRRFRAGSGTRRQAWPRARSRSSRPAGDVNVSAAALRRRFSRLPVGRREQKASCGSPPRLRGA